jgi:hypothetical protein
MSKYIGWIFQSFFRWWWAAITGAASIIALFVTPESGLKFSNIGVSIIILVFLTFTFLMVSVLVQGWSLFCDRNRQLEVVSIRRSKDLGSDWIFVINGYLPESQGVLIEVWRPLEDTEVPFAIIKVVGTTGKGYHQAVPIWISPGHLRDFSLQEFDASILRAKTILSFDRVWEAFRESDK